jgi:hypothetical protein
MLLLWRIYIMKRFLIAATLTSAAYMTPAFAADVGISVSIGQPGFYGQLDIGGYPPPQVIYNQPIAVQRVPMDRPPIYLHVPPRYAKHWGQHCHEYNACGERVYFVHDDWYNREYAPRYQEVHHEHHEEYRDNRHEERRDGRQDERRDNYNGEGHRDNHDH